MKHHCPSCYDKNPAPGGTHHPDNCPVAHSALRRAVEEVRGHDPKAAVAAPKQRIASCVPPVSIVEEARAMAFGAFTKGYGPFNWRGKQLSINVYLDAIMRHLLALIDGEDYAADSKVHHLSHIKAGCGILLDALHNGELVDDRPRAGATPKLLANPESDQPHRPSRLNDDDHAKHLEARRAWDAARESVRPPAISTQHDGVAEMLDRMSQRERGGY